MPKNNDNNDPSWLAYERCVSTWVAEEFGSLEMSVNQNVKLVGDVSKTSRQIDVLIDLRWRDDSRSRVIVDAKRRGRKVDISEVEKFEGMMRDCKANRGILVCQNGYTPAAAKRANESVLIVVKTMKDLEKFEFSYEPCLRNCDSIGRGKRRSGVLWGDCLGVKGSDKTLSVLNVGKCDGCHSFHVWCWDCGGKFAIPDFYAYQCGCERNWSVVPDNDGVKVDDNPRSMWLLMREASDLDGLPLVIDRRPLR